MRTAWIASALLISCVRPESSPLGISGQATIGLVQRPPDAWLGWIDDGSGAHQLFALREGDQVYLLEPQDPPEVLGLAPGALDVTDQACIDSELQRPLPPLASARGLELVDGGLRPLGEEVVDQRLASVFLRSAPRLCKVGCPTVQDGSLRCVDPCPPLIEPEAPTAPTPPTPPNPCPDADPCAPFAAEPACPPGSARMLGSYDCEPVGTECGPDLKLWPAAGATAVYVDADGDPTGIPAGQSRPDLQAALDDPNNEVIVVRGRFDRTRLVVVGPERQLTIVAHCPAAAVLPPLQILGRVELRDVSIDAARVAGLSVEGTVRLNGVHIMGPGNGIQGGTAADVVLRDVLIEDVEVGIASEGKVDVERLAVRGRTMGVSVSRAQLTLRRARLEGLPVFTGGALQAIGSTATVAQVAVDGAGGLAVSFSGGTAVVEDLWTNRTEGTAVYAAEVGIQLRRISINNAGTRGLVGHRTRALVLEDYSLDQGPGPPIDSDGLTLSADPGETTRAVRLQRLKIRGDRFGNVVSLSPTANGFTATTACPLGRSCNLVEDLDIEGSVNNERDSVAVQAGLSTTVYRRVRLREWRDTGFSMGPDAFADIEDWTHESSVRSDFGFRLNHVGLVADLRRVALRGVVVGFEVAAGNISVAQLRVTESATALQRGIGLQDTNLKVEDFDLRTTSAVLAIQELSNIGLYRLERGQLESQAGTPILGAECSNQYLGLDQVRLLTP